MGAFNTIILAGGYGTRLGDLGRRTAKPLLKLGDRCLLDYVVDKACEIDTHSPTCVLVNSQFLSQYQDWIAGHEQAAHSLSVSPTWLTSTSFALRLQISDRAMRRRVSSQPSLMWVNSRNIFLTKLCSLTFSSLKTESA